MVDLYGGFCGRPIREDVYCRPICGVFMVGIYAVCLWYAYLQEMWVFIYGVFRVDISAELFMIHLHVCCL